ncbi:MAG TPA: ERCC4 domain-containing protein [Candidatus Methanoperedens sp.]|nr:ERCC4 domain-containing protein [Candidatus Methanoperedens sp.]
MKVFIDHREMRSRVAEGLVKLGAEIEITTLEIGDYVVSDRVAFERKTVDDIFSTLLERRELFSQLFDLAKSYRKPILIIEGEDIFFFSSRKVNPKAIQGFLNTIALMRIPTLYTLNEAETAQVISMIALKEQNDKTRPFNFHGKRSRLSQIEMKEYIISSLPGIGQVTSRNLLNHFGSVENIVTAPREELMKVERVGFKTAKRIREIAGGQYESKQNND